MWQSPKSGGFIRNRVFTYRNAWLVQPDGKVNLVEFQTIVPAGHSVRARPGLIPNPEVKPHVAVILVRCVSPREVAVLAPFFIFDCSSFMAIILESFAQINRKGKWFQGFASNDGKVDSPIFFDRIDETGGRLNAMFSSQLPGSVANLDKIVNYLLSRDWLLKQKMRSGDSTIPKLNLGEKPNV